ncbi:enoyl-CoA hydratase/isomerase family protein [Acidaminobacter sp. JC074]|uniref:enoyl-CoA hydratase/isomerase family protein n=1 Tax=Acidaminobacter sp. JC074 TaxID=2530199 RepID=UPI001F0CFABF|nr:enoyl-CoA hydratase/isomerase family protein [Acidaminobacter sp. JC074]MCH4889817.1 enoyl-CoA hydratase/isomerase family protein [Acidaminobacter sp. JC074]
MSISFEVKNHVGYITLNRPEKLNALSYEMIKDLYEQLVLWKEDKDVLLICMEGAGEKAFSAGGDVVHLYEKRNEDIETYAFGFFYTEYCMNLLMHTYPKPILTYMNGIVMGGGVGVAVAGSHRLINEKTKWAMPEMNIGLYPDVGGSYFLNKSPGHLGRYLALTSKVIRPDDILFSNAADYMIDSNAWLNLKDDLNQMKWRETDKDLNKLISKYKIEVKDKGHLREHYHLLEKHFSYDSLEEIMMSLKDNLDDPYLKDIYETLSQKSPTSLKVTLEQLIRGQGKSIKECLVMELDMSMNFMLSHDFFEGVRAVLVDKDKDADWQPNALEEVTKQEVESYFSYKWDGNNPLVDFEI